METNIFTVPKELLPQVSTKYPMLYLEHGRIEIDDRSVKFINADGEIISIPCGMINAILLGNGTSITHDAIKILAEYNCHVFWVGEDGLKFYAHGLNPTNNTKNFQIQMECACNENKSLNIAKKMFAKRFENIDISNKTLAQLKGMEGIRVKEQYKQFANQFNIQWNYRDAHINEFNNQTATNQYLTMFNQYLYAILCSATLSLGFSPHIGFIHKSSPLPFIYDMADLYKKDLCIYSAFELTKIGFDKETASYEFVKRAKKMNLLKIFVDDIKMLFGEYMK